MAFVPYRKRGGPFVEQERGTQRDEDGHEISQPGFSWDTLLADLMRAFRNLHKCDVLQRCLNADLVDGLHATEIVTVLDIAGLTSATPASGDLFIFADISDSDAVRKATLAAINAILDHGTLAGLGDDDHSIYLLASAAGGRATFATNWTDLTDAGATTLHKHDHGGMDGLTDDDHTQYALLAGRAGGQEIIGGTASGNDLRLQSTSNATRGEVVSEDVFQTEKGRKKEAGTTSSTTTLTAAYQILVVDTASVTVNVPDDFATFAKFSWEVINESNGAITIGNNGVNINNSAANLELPSKARAHIDYDPDNSGWLVTISTTTEVATAVTAASAFGTTDVILRSDTTGRGAKAAADKMQARVFRNTSDQTIGAATWTKVQLNGETFDTQSVFDSATNYRYTPTKAGKYTARSRVLSNVDSSTFVAGPAGSSFNIAIYKNGAVVAYGMAGFEHGTGDSSVMCAMVADEIDMNGSTDYLEIFAYSQAGCNITNGTAETYASFERVD